MTGFRIERLPFDPATLAAWRSGDRRFRNWPVVYTLTGSDHVYVGETVNAVARLRQHLAVHEKSDRLDTVRVVFDDEFNKSVCLDLEAHLIRWFSGDGRFRTMNRNDGITDADYFERSRYQASFRKVFEELREQGVFTRTIPQIENGNLFKLSPYKALNEDQAVAVESILEGLFDSIRQGAPSTVVVQGDPGTGKTIVGIYLMKLLRDIAGTTDSDEIDGGSRFSEFFLPDYPDLLQNLRIGIVVPQQSLRRSIRNVFARVPGLEQTLVLTPFDVGASREKYDILVVDETHRLTQWGAQAHGSLTARYQQITTRLFGWADPGKTQLDWILAQSTHQILLLDEAQAIRPLDLPAAVVRGLIDEAQRSKRSYPLRSQMRVQGGNDYIDHVREMLGGGGPAVRDFGEYEFRLFDDLGAMHDAIRERDREAGLARLVAGYAWKWKSQKAPDQFDIELDGRRLRWNRTPVDWINSPGSLEEVGSIHTVQGYDLNYAGVIIGNDLRYDAAAGRIVFHRASYFDAKGKANNRLRDITYSDEDLLRLVTQIYAVLLTRGVRGTYVYVCDPALRQHLAGSVPRVGA